MASATNVQNVKAENPNTGTTIDGRYQLPSRIESGYGSDHFDASAVVERLQYQKVRDDSQRSTDSTDSVTSEIGTSHSVSPKSCSSTNLSIHSYADEEIEKYAKTSRIKSLKKIVMPDKKTHYSKEKYGSKFG